MPWPTVGPPPSPTQVLDASPVKSCAAGTTTSRRPRPAESPECAVLRRRSRCPDCAGAAPGAGASRRPSPRWIAQPPLPSPFGQGSAPAASLAGRPHLPAAHLDCDLRVASGWRRHRDQIGFRRGVAPLYWLVCTGPSDTVTFLASTLRLAGTMSAMPTRAVRPALAKRSRAGSTDVAVLLTIATFRVSLRCSCSSLTSCYTPRRVARCWRSRASRVVSKVCSCGQAVVVRSRTSRTRSGEYVSGTSEQSMYWVPTWSTRKKWSPPGRPGRGRRTCASR